MARQTFDKIFCITNNNKTELSGFFGDFSFDKNLFFFFLIFIKDLVSPLKYQTTKFGCSTVHIFYIFDKKENKRRDDINY